MHGVNDELAFCRNFHYESSRISPGLLETDMGTVRCASRRGSDLVFLGLGLVDGCMVHIINLGDSGPKSNF